MKDIDKHNDYISENENNLEEKLQNKTGDEDTHMLVLDKQIKREKIEEHLDKNDSKFVLRVLKKIWLMVFLLWFIYLVTFMMFPGVTLKRKVESVGTYNIEGVRHYPKDTTKEKTKETDHYLSYNL